jgi:hypothetical protein
MRHQIQGGKVKAHVLVATGLHTPKGLAFDSNDGLLYVADSGAQKVFRYKVIVDNSEEGKPTLSATHSRQTVLEHVGPVEWITLDDDGNLFYSAPQTNSINKVPTEVMQGLARGEIQASAMTVISETTLEVNQVVASKKNASQKSDIGPTDPPDVQPHILSLYEAKVNPHVSRPAAIWVDGPHIFWTNQQNGNIAGTVVQGQADPKIEANSTKGIGTPFASEALINISSSGGGLAKVGKRICFVRNDTRTNSSIISSFVPGSNIVLDWVQSLERPRALAWDKERSMFVADEIAGAVYEVAVGKAMADAPTTSVVSVPGAYGVVVTSSTDQWFDANTVNTAQAVS